MKKVIWIIAVLVGGGYFVNSYLENKAIRKADRKAEQVEAKRIELAANSAVAQMVSQTNAIDDWTFQLLRGREIFRSEPILTAELENLWLQNRPILFIGSIRDISTQDQSHYMITVEGNLSLSFEGMLGTQLQLSLISEKERIDSFLKKNPDSFKKNGFRNYNAVAVVARIKTVRTTFFTGSEGESEEVKIGDGELVDILYTGDIAHFVPKSLKIKVNRR